MNEDRQVKRKPSASSSISSSASLGGYNSSGSNITSNTELSNQSLTAFSVASTLAHMAKSNSRHKKASAAFDAAAKANTAKSALIEERRPNIKRHGGTVQYHKQNSDEGSDKGRKRRRKLKREQRKKARRAFDAQHQGHQANGWQGKASPVEVENQTLKSSNWAVQEIMRKQANPQESGGGAPLSPPRSSSDGGAATQKDTRSVDDRNNLTASEDQNKMVTNALAGFLVQLTGAMQNGSSGGFASACLQRRIRLRQMVLCPHPCSRILCRDRP